MPLELQLPVEKISALLVLHDGKRKRVTLFLPGGEGVEKVLCDSAPFLPIEEEGSVSLYTRSSLACVTVHCEEGEATTTRRRAVMVRLKSGVVMEGEILAGRQRTSDFLNEESATLAVHTGRSITYLFKTHIESVTEDKSC